MPSIVKTAPGAGPGIFGTKTEHGLNKRLCAWERERNHDPRHALTFEDMLEVTLPKTIPTQKARQGRRGWQVLVVLACGLILAGLVWFGVEIYGEAIDTNTVGDQPAAQTN